MSDILPIDPAKIKDDEIKDPTEPIKMEVKDKELQDKELQDKDYGMDSAAGGMDEEEEIDELPRIGKKTIFEVPKVPEVVISKITGKPKRKCSEKKLQALKKAQQASMAKRAAMKEQKELEKAHKRLDIQKRKKEKMDKKLESDTTLELRQQIYAEEVARAKKDATWDEERLTALMNNTISNFLSERKKQKPVPKQFIPAPQSYPQYAPQQQPAYYQPQSQPQPPPPKPQYTYKQQSANNNVMSDLFGFNGN